VLPHRTPIWPPPSKKAIGKEKVVYISLPGAEHGGPAFETTENLDKVFAFSTKYLQVDMLANDRVTR